MKIFIFSGKARHGKDTGAEFVKEFYKNKKVLNIQFAKYLKMYAEVIGNWDGKEEDKPRDLLQKLGSEIRQEINSKFFIKRTIEDIKVYQKYYDIITISDARFEDEIEDIKKSFKNVYSMHIVRSNFNDNLTEEQRKHPTETALDNYKNFDYIIQNDNTLETYKIKITNILKEME